MLLSCSTFELSSWFKGTILMDAFLELHCRCRWLRQCRCQSQEPHTIVEFVELKWIEKSQQCLEASCSGLTQWFLITKTRQKLTLLEIKPFVLGSRIRDMEAESYNWFTFRLLFISFGKQKWHCGMNQRLSWVPKCALVITFLASNSLHNHGGQK